MEKKNITVNLQIETIKKLDKIVGNYIFPSRSSLINYCIELSVPIINKELKSFKKNIELNNFPKVLEYLKSHGFVIHPYIQSKEKVPLGNIHFNSNNDKELPKVFK